MNENYNFIVSDLKIWKAVAKMFVEIILLLSMQIYSEKKKEHYLHIKLLRAEISNANAFIIINFGRTTKKGVLQEKSV